MKILQYLGMTTVIALSMTSIVKAGGVAGGGGPPAKQALEPETATLFLWDDRSLGLDVDQPLMPTLTVTHTAAEPASLVLSNDDFNQVATKAQQVNVVNRSGDLRSYRVLEGPSADTLLLVDRRLLMRTSARTSP